MRSPKNGSLFLLLLLFLLLPIASSGEENNYFLKQWYQLASQAEQMLYEGNYLKGNDFAQKAFN